MKINLDWTEHIDFVKKKISGGIYALNSCKKILSNANMRTLYHSLVHPCLFMALFHGAVPTRNTHTN